MKQYEQAEWVTCRHCDGSGLNVTDDQICDCLGGLVDMAGSGWSQRVAPRPPRLNFAGYCIWCDERWCEEAECVERHTHSHWDVCDRCDGLGYDEPTGPPAVAPTDSLKRPSQTDDQPHRF
ncbi:MAG: hypothetical protein GY773_31560 [Actinomycetia bacterium]|nr:hypothetical protein [Actinomycetes bacterium]